MRRFQKIEKSRAQDGRQIAPRKGMAVTSRIQADLRLAAAILSKSALLFLLLIVLSSVWLAPFIYLTFGASVIDVPGLRFILFLDILVFWSWAQAVTYGDIRAIRSAKPISRRARWFVEVPRATQLWASDLIDVVESHFVHLRWKLQLCLSFVPCVEYSPIREEQGRGWQLAIGLSTIAFLSRAELAALLITSGYCRFCWASRPHFLLIGLLRKAERAKSALPPHPGFFSFARFLVEAIVKILEPLPAQLEEWSVNLAGRSFGESTVRSALLKSRTAGLLQGSYLSFYESSAVKRGLMPPYVEGMWRLYGRTFQSLPGAAYKDLAGLWVYERRLLEACLGRDCVSQLRPADWDELQQDFGCSWSQSAAELRTVLGDARVADIPKLVCEWRNVLRQWLIHKQRAPVVTPDRQRELFLFLLGAALGAVLLQAGWQVVSAFGEEISLVKESRSVSPFRLISELSSGRLSSTQYERECNRAGIGDLWLGVPCGEVSGINCSGSSARQ